MGLLKKLAQALLGGAGEAAEVQGQSVSVIAYEDNGETEFETAPTVVAREVAHNLGGHVLSGSEVTPDTEFISIEEAAAAIAEDNDL